ncbi:MULTISPECIES: multidrug effflux MFS transporter [Subtercola]|uniref:Bcr/CflA family efflux MFS transporter n=1 Tax=Subtercola vilae TaxID=2056433 RepID=A0A4T2BEH1_9MICO|nr:MULTISPECIES: multidrug effflux MFS transporter [Subtercola]MEA9986665.1 multidrug effflux MFS transporter [Subtercola sp. RTI3]TIH28929.1 Bcr/CflA family efflux MFS transporter [Subtercola vilae]
MNTAVHPGDALTSRQRLVYIIILGALSALGPFTIDLYLPAFPALEADLNVPVAVIQLTLTGTTIGFALGQLLVGPWSDSVGRRLPLIVATALHIAASIGAAVAPNVEVLGVLRVLQGVGAAAAGVIAIAMVRDLFAGQPLVRMLSRMSLVTTVAPVLAPVVGSQLLNIMDWRGIFWVLMGYGIVVLIAASVWIVETLPKERRGDRGHTSMRQRYSAVLHDRVFVGMAIIGGMTFAGLFSYLSASPFLFQVVYAFSPQQYGLLFAVNSLGIILGIQSSAFLIRRIAPQWLLACSTVVLLLSAVAIVVLDVSGAGLFGVLIPLWFFIAACGFGGPCVQVLALNNHGHEAATAASLLGAVNFGLAGLISPIVGAFGVGNAVAMGAVMAVTAAVSITVLWAVVRPRTVPSIAH